VSGPGVNEGAAEARVVRALTERGRFGIRLGLGRITALLRVLGDPQRQLRGALIAGTNGKGSVQALVAAALRETGIRVGQTPKPHLVSYRERLVVDGEPIPPSDFASLIEDVLEAGEAVPRRLGPPTEFELVTAAAFEWFRRSEVQVGVVEVGLGGRLDATNAWDGGVAAITTVALDHTEHLGPTLRDIGREKAGIIKRGDLCVSGVTGEGALPIRRRARRLGVPLTEVSALPVLAMDRGGLTLVGPDGSPLRIGLLGRHQARNAAVALGVLDALRDAGICTVDPDSIRRGLADARWPGRLELLALGADGGARRSTSTAAATPGAPDLLLDGAHNPEGAQALASALDELRPVLSGGRPTVLTGIVREKDVAGIVSALRDSVALRDARIIATTVPDSSRSLDATDLAAAWGAVEGQRVDAIADPAHALETALEAARASDGPLLVCGSLYLVGWVRGRLIGEAA